MTQSAWEPIVAITVGFVLGQVAGTVKWLYSSRKERQLVRLLVALETDQNLALLNDYWQNVSLAPDADEAGDPPGKRESEADRLARRAREIPLPVLSDRAFISQLGALPRALSDSDIRLVWRVYEEIAQVREIHAWLVAIAAAPSSGKENFPSASRAIRSGGLLSATFTTKGAGAIFDLRATIERLLRAGNPLGRPVQVR